MSRVAAIQKSSLHHHDRLEMLAIALPQGSDQLRILLAALRMEPLLELVQDQQHLLAGSQHASLPDRHQGFDQTQASRQIGTGFAQRPEKAGFRLLRRRLDVNRKDMFRQPGQKSRLHERRLAATRGPVDQSHPEGFVGIGPFNQRLPEPDAVGQSLPVSWSGQ